MNHNTIEWLSSIATALIMLIGMFIAWNPFYPLEILGFLITFIGFTLGVFLSLGIIKFRLNSDKEQKTNSEDKI